jgi:predicted RNase H-like nuclease (RuvC/YqgF family)
MWPEDFEESLQKRVDEGLAKKGFPNGTVTVRILGQTEDLLNYPDFKERLYKSTNLIRQPAQTEDDSIRRLNKQLSQSMELNHKRVTKINRLRQGIRSLQACHERDQREIANLRQKLAKAGLRITQLERMGLDDE